MKIRHKGSSGEDKIELQMTPMIDIVFQLLVFFILTFKVVAQEADFNIRMPAQASRSMQDISPQVLKVRITAGEGGAMSDLKLDGASLGNGLEAFVALRDRVRKLVDDSAGPTAAASLMEVEFDCDYELAYDYVIRAIDAISGYKEGSGDQARITRMIEKIRFAQTREPKS
ncbi:MAG: biopolymer transporter ExbD [Planctomycetales bacterium]|nr:biopolymer transporter ExbD [Planctomycetales bacterium]NIM07844.1 biopolymer transporter ExbD [Planctomycetales bacterium]NIN07336.1 biopolymer transporter ExbD [Planctomycetales bacterium]NIN76439.1 biopolymer transporter ExbD [Planctomycetales bacterium]NIO33635.1 biopolymer transporter ExbD [Planctomycetales bacterium]